MFDFKGFTLAFKQRAASEYVTTEQRRVLLISVIYMSNLVINVNVNVHVYSPDIPVGSADCTIYTPGIGTHSFTVSSPLGSIQHLRTLLQL